MQDTEKKTTESFVKKNLFPLLFKGVLRVSKA